MKTMKTMRTKRAKKVINEYIDYKDAKLLQKFRAILSAFITKNLPQLTQRTIIILCRKIIPLFI